MVAVVVLVAAVVVSVAAVSVLWAAVSVSLAAASAFLAAASTFVSAVIGIFQLLYWFCWQLFQVLVYRGSEGSQGRQGVLITTICYWFCELLCCTLGLLYICVELLHRFCWLQYLLRISYCA